MLLPPFDHARPATRLTTLDTLRPPGAIERAKKRDVLRNKFTPDERNAIIAGQEELRDKIALRLLLDYGLRKGALRAIQFKHFDHQRRRLTIFTKGEKIRELPIPQPEFWHDLGRLLIDLEAKPHHYLLARQKATEGEKRDP
jgi:integrase